MYADHLKTFKVAKQNKLLKQLNMSFTHECRQSSPAYSVYIISNVLFLFLWLDNQTFALTQLSNEITKREKLQFETT